MTVNFGESNEASESIVRQAPVLDITELSQGQIGRLSLKLAEYVMRDRARGVDGYIHPELAFLLRKAEVFKAPMLDYILKASQAPGRDIKREPITLSEVAGAMEGLFAIDLSASKATAFVWNQDRPDTVRPDFEKILENGGTQEDFWFSEVYAILRAYCIDQPEGVVGGTGLPELSVEAPVEG